MVKNPSANAGDVRDIGSIPGSERSSGRLPWWLSGKGSACRCQKDPLEKEMGVRYTDKIFPWPLKLLKNAALAMKTTHLSRLHVSRATIRDELRLSMKLSVPRMEREAKLARDSCH